jgi:hypothetical protein
VTPLRIPAVLVLAAALGAGCSGGADGTGGGATSTAVPAASGGGTAYDSVAALADTLTAKGLTCPLQYAGLHDDLTGAELSICTVAGDQAYLRVWNDPASIASFVASPQAHTGTVAVGANWTVSVTAGTTAEKIAGALGGTVPSPTG